jgi:putative DNA primase/helicase
MGTVADINAAKPEEREPSPPDSLAEIALSNDFAQSPLGASLRYCDELGCFLFYDEDKGCWRPDRKLTVYTEAKRHLTSVARRIADGAAKPTTPLNSRQRVAAVVELTKSHKRIAILPEQLDADPWLLNTPSGVVDLRTGVIRKARREDYFTKITKVAPKRMDTPVFDQFMLDIMGAKIPPKDCECAACAKRAPEERTIDAHLAEVRKLVRYLLRRYGYALSGDVKKHGLVMQLGDGGNGKGLLNDFLSQEVWGTCSDGGYACDLAVEALLKRKGFEAHPTELMDLFHTRLVLAREADEETQWNAGRVKRLSGGDRIKARRMRQDFIEFDATHHLFIFGNNKPILPGSDQAAWKRRLALVMFPQSYGTADPVRNILAADEKLLDKLRPEAPGVLQKLIDAGIECLSMTGFDPPETILQASDTYLAEQNYILQWLDESCDRSNPYGTATATELFSDYGKWALKASAPLISRVSFNGRLRKAEIQIGTNHAGQKGICRGITLKTSPEPEPSSGEEIITADEWTEYPR